MTPQELVALFDVGIWGRAADRLAFLRWCVRRDGCLLIHQHPSRDLQHRSYPLDDIERGQ